MAIRFFIFCDICNPQCVRTVEGRRTSRRNNDGRRISDGRAWFDGKLEDATADGWKINADGNHICPHCQELRRDQMDFDRPLSG